MTQIRSASTEFGFGVVRSVESGRAILGFPSRGADMCYSKVLDVLFQGTGLLCRPSLSYSVREGSSYWSDLAEEKFRPVRSELVGKWAVGRSLIGDARRRRRSR